MNMYRCVMIMFLGGNIYRAQFEALRSLTSYYMMSSSQGKQLALCLSKKTRSSLKLCQRGQHISDIYCKECCGGSTKVYNRN